MFLMKELRSAINRLTRRFRQEKSNRFYLCLIACSLFVSCQSGESERLRAVRIYADNVLKKGADRWSGKNTPLLADGVNVRDNEPLKYVYNGEIGVHGEGGAPNEWITHNLASQQNLFRTFVALTNLTGDEKYRNAAESAIRYHFDSLMVARLDRISDCFLVAISCYR